MGNGCFILTGSHKLDLRDAVSQSNRAGEQAFGICSYGGGEGVGGTWDLLSCIWTFKSALKEIYMNYIGVSELKQTKRMWEMLDSEGELVLTKEGKPGAVILAVTPETLESTVRSIRRARFSDLVAQNRSKGAAMSESEIETEIAAYRAGRA